MSTTQISDIELNDGFRIPAFGTSQLKGMAAVESISTALSIDYLLRRHCVPMTACAFWPMRPTDK
jgi:hypothetical protein